MARIGDDPDRYLPQASLSLPLKAKRSGILTRLDALTAGRAGVELGAGRDKQEDKLDFGAGILLNKKVGDPVRAGEEIARLFASNASRLRRGHDMLAGGVTVGSKRPRRTSIIKKVWK